MLPIPLIVSGAGLVLFVVEQFSDKKAEKEKDLTTQDKVDTTPPVQAKPMPTEPEIEKSTVQPDIDNNDSDVSGGLDNSANST